MCVCPTMYVHKVCMSIVCVCVFIVCVSCVCSWVCVCVLNDNLLTFMHVLKKTCLNVWKTANSNS